MLNFNFKNILFLFCIISLFKININYAVTYPTVALDLYTNILKGPISAPVNDPMPLDGGDNVGWNVATSPDSVGKGICWFPYGISITDVIGVSDEVDLATPLAIGISLSLSDVVTLRLRSDILFASDLELVKSGLLKCGNRFIALSGSFFLNNQTITTTDNYGLQFDGNGNYIDFKEGGKIVNNDNSYLKFRNTYLLGIQQNSIQAPNSYLTLSRCIIDLDGDYTFHSSKFLEIYGDCLITGTHTFCLDSECLIHENANLIFDIGSTFSMGLHGKFTMLENKEGTIHFNGCNIQIGSNVTSNGFSLDYGNIIFENRVIIDDMNMHKCFSLGANTKTKCLSGASIILDGTTTFSIF